MKEKNNTIAIVVSGASAILIAGLIVFVIDPITFSNASWKTLLVMLLSTVVTVLVANVLWEVIAKQRFANHMLELARISENIAKSGIDAVYIDFNKINWDDEFRKTREFRAVFTYAKTWRESHRRDIEEFVKTHKKHNNNSPMTIVVPNIFNETIMGEFDRRFNVPKGRTKEQIEDSILFFYNMGADVYLFDESLHASYYITDQAAFMSFFRHSHEKGYVPALRAEKNGEFYKYIQKEYETILSNSKKVKKCSSVSVGDSEKKEIEVE